MEIIYLLTGNEWFDYRDFVMGLVHQYGLRRICDVGGGAHPILPLQLVNDHQLECIILDISSTELAKGPREYKKLVQDIETENFALTNQFDLVIRKMIAEHVRNGQRFHKNIFSMLKCLRRSDMRLFCIKEASVIFIMTEFQPSARCIRPIFNIWQTIPLRTSQVLPSWFYASRRTAFHWTK
jgi:hypothetical protein